MGDATAFWTQLAGEPRRGREATETGSSSARPSVGILGGGTAGLLTALALRRWEPSIEVTLLESPRVPIIGVGEATTPALVAFLHRVLDLDAATLHEAVRPTFKLGILFDWGPPDAPPFPYAFGPGEVAEALAYDSHLARYSLSSMLMRERRAPVLAGEEQPCFLPRARFAYHLDNRRFHAFLRDQAAAHGVARVEATVKDVAIEDRGDTPHLRHLIGEDGATYAFDFYVDCSGFGSVLMEKALGSPFVDFSASLFCDSAVVGETPFEGEIPPYTLAETMDAGWCWTIPVVDELHRGYVFASSFIEPEDALAELCARHPDVGETRVVRFRSGRHRDFLRGNVAAIGNAYGFVEPLESTGLHMVVVQVARLLRLLAWGGSRDEVNTEMAQHWDFLRWFLALHYRFNGRRDSDFWRECRRSAAISGLEAAVEGFRGEGPLSGRPDPPELVGDEVFGVRGIDVILGGQGVATATQPRWSRTAWEEHCALRRGLVARALPHRRALEQLRAEPEPLEALFCQGENWCRLLERELVRRAALAARAGGGSP